MKFLPVLIVLALLAVGCVQPPSVSQQSNISNQNGDGTQSESSPTPSISREFLNLTLDDIDYSFDSPKFDLIGISDNDYNLRIWSNFTGDPRLTIDMWSYSDSNSQQPLVTGRTYDVSFGAMTVRLVREGVTFNSRDDYEFVLVFDAWPSVGQLATGRFNGILVDRNTNNAVVVRGNFALLRPEFAPFPISDPLPNEVLH